MKKLVSMIAVLLIAACLIGGLVVANKAAVATETTEAAEVTETETGETTEATETETGETTEAAETTEAETTVKGWRQVNGRSFFFGTEEEALEAVGMLSLQEWLLKATVDLGEGVEFYAEAGKNVYDEDVARPADAETFEEVSVIRIGNAFVVAEEAGDLVVNREVDKVPTMSDRKAFSLCFCQKHEALKASAVTKKACPEAENRVGSLRVEAGLNRDLFKALRLEKVTVNGEECFGIAWLVCGDKDKNPAEPHIVEPTTEPTAKPAEPTAEPTVEPTAEPTAKPEHEPEATLPPKQEEEKPAHEAEPTIPPKEEKAPTHEEEKPAPEKGQAKASEDVQQKPAVTLPPKQQEKPAAAHSAEADAPAKVNETF